MTVATVNGTPQLTELLKAGRSDAFSELYDKYAAALYNIICRIVQNDAASEELLQDVFVKVWKNIGRYDASKGTLFTWMLHITRNTCIDHLRSSGHRSQPGGDKKLREETIPTPPEIRYNSENTELRGLAFKLEHKYRQVIDLVYFWGYSQEEVAQLLQIPLGTVKTRSRSGLQQLRELYTEENKIRQ